MRSVIQMMLWPPFLAFNISTDPARIYKDQGWAGFQDWLGGSWNCEWSHLLGVILYRIVSLATNLLSNNT